MKKTLFFLLSLAIISNYQVSFGAPTNEDIQRYSAYYSNGMQNLKNQQFSSAISDFKKVLRFSPYDDTTKGALVNAYFARGQNYKQQTKEYKKALNDYKSAYFYATLWSKNNSQTVLSIANSAQKEINDLEKRLMVSQNPDSRFQNAKITKAQGELAASGYDFNLLLNSKYKTQAYENLGNIYKNLNNLMKAMDYFKTAIDNNPKDPKLHFLYGVMLDEAGNFEASMEQYNLSLQYGDSSPELLEILENKWTQNIVNNPNDSQNYVNLGAIYQKQGKFDDAKNQYQKAYQLNSSDDTILYNLASLYIQQKAYQNAIGVYDKLLLKKPNNIEVLDYKANALLELQKYDEALKQYETILSLEPNNQNAKAKVDDIVLNHFSGAKFQNYLLTKAKNSPNNYEAQFNYALEMHKNKNYPEAIAYYNKALNLNPAKEEVYINLSSIYLEQKNYERASEIAQKGLLILPSSQKLAQALKDSKTYYSGSIYEKATKLYNEKQYSAAINEYLKVPNKTKEVQEAIASCYWQLNDFNNANKYYLEILSKNPNDVENLVNSAWAYYSLNDFNNAKLTSERILALDKNNSEAKNIIQTIINEQNSNMLNDVIAKYEQGKFQESLNLANKLLQKTPNDEYALYYKGLCFDELKNPQEAIKTYQLLVSKKPDFAPAYYSLGVALDNKENYQEAVKNYEKFISLKASLKESDEMTNFANSRIKELKDYLSQIQK